MDVSIILAHPTPGSFNHALAEAAAGAVRDNGHTACFHDLYEERFPPVLPGDEIPEEAVLPDHVALHCREIADAHGIVVVHPDWWGQPPAILTGWIDRVMRPGVAYRFLEGDGGEGVPLGLLKARTAVVINTSNTPSERETGVFGDPLESIWKRCVFGLCGVDDVRRLTLSVVITSSPQQRAAWLEEVRGLVTECFPAED